MIPRGRVVNDINRRLFLQATGAAVGVGATLKTTASSEKPSLTPVGFKKAVKSYMVHCRGGTGREVQVAERAGV
jgi:hypothetical protein